MQLEVGSRHHIFLLLWLSLPFHSWKAQGAPRCSCEAYQYQCSVDNVYSFPKDIAGEVNVAVGKPVTMTSRVESATHQSAQPCVTVNGRPERRVELNPQNPKCVQTGSHDMRPNLTINLQNEYQIVKIKIIWSMTPTYKGDATVGVEVFVGEDSIHQFTEEQDEESIVSTFRPGDVVTIGKRRTSIIDDAMKLCQVEVFACRPGFYGPECRVCDSPICDNGQVCDPVEGTCPKIEILANRIGGSCTTATAGSRGSCGGNALCNATTDGVCQCVEGFEGDEGDLGCQIQANRIGGRCSTDKVGSQGSCETNALCNATKFCQCVAGYKGEIGDFKCTASEEQPEDCPASTLVGGCLGGLFILIFFTGLGLFLRPSRQQTVVDPPKPNDTVNKKAREKEAEDTTEYTEYTEYTGDTRDSEYTGYTRDSEATDFSGSTVDPEDIRNDFNAEDEKESGGPKDTKDT